MYSDVPYRPTKIGPKLNELLFDVLVANPV